MGQVGTTMRDSKREPTASEAASTSGGGREAVATDAETSCWSADGAAPAHAPTTTAGSVAELSSSTSEEEDSGEDTAEDWDDEDSGGTVCTLLPPPTSSDWSHRVTVLAGRDGKSITLALVKELGAGGFGSFRNGAVRIKSLLSLTPHALPLRSGAVLAAQVIDGGAVPELVEGTLVALKYDLKVTLQESLAAVRKQQRQQQQAPPRWTWSPSTPLVELPVASVVREAHAIARLHRPSVARALSGSGVQAAQQPLVPAWCIPAIIPGWPAVARAADARAADSSDEDEGDASHVQVNCTCILMPLYGMNVYRWLSRQQALHGVCLQEVCRLGQAMLACVLRVHAAGMLHLDIKPENFVLRDAAARDQDGIAGGLVLLDFGLSCDATGHTPVKSSNNDDYFYGTPSYASQLQLKGKEPLSFRDDLEAIFNILAEAAAGEPLPWRFKLPNSDEANCPEGGGGVTSQDALGFQDALQQRCRIDSHRDFFAAFFANQPAPLRRLDAAVQALRHAEMPDYQAMMAALHITAAEVFQWDSVIGAAYADGRRVHPIPCMCGDGRKRKRETSAAEQGPQGSAAPGALGSHAVATVALRKSPRTGGSHMGGAAFPPLV